MKCYELAQETGWTPAKAFEDMVEETGLEKQLKAIREPDSSNLGLQQQQLKSTQKMTCMATKCGKRAAFNFEDEPFPKFCEVHKYEGMCDVTAFLEHEHLMIRVNNEEGLTRDEEGGGCGDTEKFDEHVEGGVWDGKQKGKKIVKSNKKDNKDDDRKGPGRPSSSATEGLEVHGQFFYPAARSERCWQGTCHRDEEHGT